MTSQAVNIRELLPHDGDMVLLDELVSHTDNAIQVRVTLKKECIYCDGDGVISALLGPELMAQAIAALAGLDRRKNGLSSRLGVLLGTRRYHCRLPAFPIGVDMIVRAEELYREANGLAAFECTISIDDDLVAEARLNVFEPANAEALTAGRKQ